MVYTDFTVTFNAAILPTVRYLDIVTILVERKLTHT